jgi:hypothetical protein
VFPARDDRPYWGVHVTSVNAANAVLIHSASRLNAGERSCRCHRRFTGVTSRDGYGSGRLRRCASVIRRWNSRPTWMGCWLAS